MLKIKESLSELMKTEKELLKRKELAEKELSEINSDIDLVRSVIWLKKNPDKNPALRTTAISNADIPTKYDMNMLQEKKFFYILNELKEASVKEIAQYMHKQEDGSDFKTIYHRVQQSAIRLSKEGRILSSGDYARKYTLNMG